MDNFAKYLTPEEAKALGDERSLGELRQAARRKKPCEVCGQPAWRFGNLGMCFPCTTGESDASGDYELEQL